MNKVTWIPVVPVCKELPSDFTRKYYVTIYSPNAALDFFVYTLYFYPDGTWEKIPLRDPGEIVIAWAKKPVPKKIIKPKKFCDEYLSFGSSEDPESGWFVWCQLKFGHEGQHQSSNTGDSDKPYFLQWMSDNYPKPYELQAIGMLPTQEADNG